MVGQFNSCIQSSEDLLQQYDNGFHLLLEAQRAALHYNGFQKIDIGIGVRMPLWTGIFQDRQDNAFVSNGLN